MTRYDLATFGEGQLRLTVPRGERLATARRLHLTAAGSEANVAGLLAQLGHRCAWASVIPQGELGDRILSEYRATGVDLSHVHRPATGRVALYFFEPGEPPLPGRVTYDRTHTPFREVQIDTFDWTALLDTRVLFVSGITAALTAETAKLVDHAVRSAADRGVDVVLDINHRTTLWSNRQAAETLEPLLELVSVLLCSRLDGNRVFGIQGDGGEVSRILHSRTGVPHVVTTDHASRVHYAGTLGAHDFPVTAVPVTDRPGAGDAFAGAVVHGYLDGDILGGMRQGLAAASLALTHHGDLTHLAPSDLETSESTDIVR